MYLLVSGPQHISVHHVPKGTYHIKDKNQLMKIEQENSNPENYHSFKRLFAYTIATPQNNSVRSMITPFMDEETDDSRC